MSAAFPINPDSSQPVCKNQFRQDHFPCITLQQVAIFLVPILTPPIEDGSDLPAQEACAIGWGKGTGRAGKGPTLGVFDPPAVAVADEVDGVAGSGGGYSRKRRITKPETPSKGPASPSANLGDAERELHQTKLARQH